MQFDIGMLLYSVVSALTAITVPEVASLANAVSAWSLPSSKAPERNEIK
jgi:hypothetical protein